MAPCLPSVFEVFAHQKDDLLVHLLSKESAPSSTLIFVRSREDLHALTTRLNREDLGSTSISGTKKPELREKAVRDLKSASLAILVSTEAVLRDSDLTGIAQIIYFDPPELDQDYLKSLEQASQEVVTFVSQNDQADLRNLQQLVGEQLTSERDETFAYDSQPHYQKGPVKKTHAANKTKSKPLQNKKPKLKNKGPRRKTGRTRKR